MTGQATNARRPWSIVLASREVWPFVEGGGLGRYMWSAARFLSSHAEVSILTSSRWQAGTRSWCRTGDERLPAGVRFAFVDEPEGDLSPFISWNHAWSVRLLEGVARLYPDGGPDILEMGDYQAEGFAAAHARRGQDPRLRRTALVIRMHTSAEMCAALNGAPHGPRTCSLLGRPRALPAPLRRRSSSNRAETRSSATPSSTEPTRSLPRFSRTLPMTTDLRPPPTWRRRPLKARCGCST